jgi:tetratricopeptide (TPR) repeat protein
VKRTKGFGKSSQSSDNLRLFAQAEAHQGAGRLHEAEAIYRQILKLQPDHPETLQNLGGLLCVLGDPVEGEALLGQLVSLKPNDPLAYYNLGLAQEVLQEFAQAEASYARVVALSPKFAEVYNNLGIMALRQDQFSEAQTHFQKAISLKPNFAEAHHNLGNAQLQLGRQQNTLEMILEAEASSRRAIALKSDFADGHYNLGVTLLELGQRQGNTNKLIEAEARFRKALALQPELTKAYCNLGLAFTEMGQFSAARICYDQALSKEPEHGATHNNRSHLLLLLGDFRTGWLDFGRQWILSSYRDCVQPYWDGASLTGKRILLRADYGFGDAIQFIRYVPMVKALSATVIVECRPAEERLFRTCQGIDKLVIEGEPLPEFDVYASLLSLPQIFRADLASIPATVPYLSESETSRLPESLQNQLTTATGLKIGVVWSPKQTLAIDFKRRCPLSLFEPLLQIPGLSWFSLYKGDQIDELAPYSEQIVDIGSHVQDLADTAWVIEQLDLIITVDTSVTHIAGAMGKPMWVLLPFVPDWRWLLDREDCPWYPTARLFRQPQFGDWSTVIKQIERALLEQVEGKATDPRMLLASEYEQAGRLQEAESAYRQLLTQQPENYKVLQALGMLVLKLGDPYTSESFLRQAIALEPQNADLYVDLGRALGVQSRSAEAEATCLQAVRLALQPPETYNILGNAQLDQGKLADAETSYRQAIALQPNDAEAYCNLGNVLQEAGDYQAALEAYQHASSLQPDLIAAEANQAFIHLIKGEFKIGWEKYEWRWHMGNHSLRTFDKPIWQGEDLSGKRIFICAEQGFGDTFQFIRYAELLFERRATVLVQCRSGERRLLRSCPYIHQLTVQGESFPEFDYYIPLLSLPKLLGTTLESIPVKIPYIQIPQIGILSEALQQQVQEAPGFKIGFVWSASLLRFTDRKRGCPIAHFGRLFGVADLTWFSLYKGDQSAEIAPFESVIDIGSKFQDFADTAWAIAQMDLVISVDTAVAHLAGALGKPVWVILPHTADWRWLLDREDSPWYPTMRLFRQPNPGNWQAVIEAISHALSQQFSLPAINVVSPSLTPVSVETNIELLRAYQLAVQNQEAGRLKEAVAAFQRVLKIKPEHSDALNNLGMVYQDLGDFRAAELSLRQAILLRPIDPHYHYNLSLVLANQGKVPEAELACKQAIHLDPEFAEALNTLGNLLASQGKLEDAESSYQQALALRPDFAGTLNNLGNVLAAKGALKEALACYEKALKIKPDLADATNNRAQVLVRIQAESQLLL